MKQCASLVLVILLLGACAPALAASTTSTIAFTVTSPPVTLTATDTPHPPTATSTATPRPPTATVDPTKAYITMAWGTKSVLLTAYPAPTYPIPTSSATFPPDSLSCRPKDLRVTNGVSAAAGHLILWLRLYNASSTDCFLPLYPVSQLLDPARKPLDLTYSYTVPDGPILPLQPTDEANPGQPARFGLQHGQPGLLYLWLSNECGKSGHLPKEFIIHIELLDKAGNIETAYHDFVGGAACYDPAVPPSLNIGPVEAVENQ